jgi:hypothetical protein
VAAAAAVAETEGDRVGIVSFCPQGHRVKVKDHLAGRKGVCPTCGARFRIPLASADGPADALPLARVVPLDAAAVAALPRVLLTDPTTQPKPARHAVPVAEAADPGGSAAVARYQVLDDRPDLSWSTAVPGGVASAPMAAPELRTWLDSGTVVGNELVWRADWEGWRPVGDVFPDAMRAGKTL